MHVHGLMHGADQQDGRAFYGRGREYGVCGPGEYKHGGKVENCADKKHQRGAGQHASSTLAPAKDSLGCSSRESAVCRFNKDICIRTWSRKVPLALA